MSYSEAGKLGYLKSKETLQEKNRLFRENYNNNPKLCRQCGKKIEFDKKYNNFCSGSCSATHNNIKKESRKKKNKCLYCNNDTYNLKFCNNKCMGYYRRKISIKKIENNGGYILNSNNDAVARRMLKIYLVEKNGHKCEICGNSEWMGKPIPLVLDHIDGNYLNNKLTNVRIVCGNCDMQLPTAKGKNRGNGRKRRRLDYLKGTLKEHKIIKKINLFNQKMDSTGQLSNAQSDLSDAIESLWFNNNKNKKSNKIKVICLNKNCQKEFETTSRGKRTQKYCSVYCYCLSQRKVNRPSKEELVEELKNSSYEAMGRKYGVSGVSVKKWILKDNALIVQMEERDPGTIEVIGSNPI